jgi:ketosteroid isomerase-like protein
MSQENVESLRRYQDAFNRGDRAAFLALCDPDYENVPSPEWPESQPTRGREAVWDFFVRNSDTWDEAVFNVGEVIELGDDKLVFEQQAEMKGAASGARVPWSYWQVMTFRDGKVSRTEWFRTRAEALEAVGLRE